MNIDFNKFTENARAAIIAAQEEARRNNHQQLDGWHLLSALVKQDPGIVPGVLEKMNIHPSAFELAIARELEKLPAVTGSVDVSRMYITQLIQDTFNKAEVFAGKMKDEYIS